MILTVQELITDAMSLIGAVAIDESPTVSELSLGLRTANMMIDRWSSMPGMMRSTSTVGFTTTPGKASYSVGLTGRDIPSTKPIVMSSAYVQDSGNVDYALDLVDKSFYDGLQDKNLASGRPRMIAYDPIADQQTDPYGVFYLYYTPDTTYTVYVSCSQDVTEFVDLTDSVDFEPVYYEALKYGIATRLFRHYHAVNVQIPPDLVMHEQNTIKTLYMMNHRVVLAASDLPRAGGTYNVYTDQG